jgi:hypothetical protein
VLKREASNGENRGASTTNRIQYKYMPNSSIHLYQLPNVYQAPVLRQVNFLLQIVENLRLVLRIFARYKLTRDEIEQKIDELAREFAETHDPKIPQEIYRLASLLKELDH